MVDLHCTFQKQPPEVFCKKRCQSLFFNKVAGWGPATLLKKRPWHRCFPVNFAKFFRTPFLQNTSGGLLLTFEFKLENTGEHKVSKGLNYPMQLSEYSFIFTPCTTFSGNWSYFIYSEAACKIRDDLNFWFSSEIASTVFEIYLQIYKISSWEVLSKLAFAD